MKHIAYYALHYGKEYLAHSVRSITHAVDEIHVLYAARPSFQNTSMPCPDSEPELKAEAERFITKPLIWHKGSWSSEGDHRDAIISIAHEANADQILWVDSDEVWDADTVSQVLDSAASSPERNIRVKFLHFWRSMRWVCSDQMMPTRVINLHAQSGEAAVQDQAIPVYHFGYAQSARLTRYKQSCHGHKNEWREGWFQNKFLRWSPSNQIGDVHPTSRDAWTPREVDPSVREKMAAVLSDHLYWNLELIP